MQKEIYSEAFRLLETTAKLRRDLLHTQADEAPHFNLFRILGIDGQEVSTHSAFLGHLLSPNGSHAQGDLFLRTFIVEVARLTLPSVTDWVVALELPFDKGRLDIILRSVTAKAIIAVENKIGTQDSEGQLTKYREWLDRPLRRATYTMRTLLYLTPEGVEAKHAAGIKYKLVSYRFDIVNWLQKCLGIVKPPVLQNAILLYLKTLQSMNAKASAKDDLDDKILQLLSAPAKSETRIAALRIARVAGSLKETILKDFWTAGEEYLKRRCHEAGFDQWSIDQYGEGSYQEKRSIVLTMKAVPDSKPHPQFSFNQHVTSSLFRWEWGVKYDSWIGNNNKIKSLPEASKCTAELEEVHDMPAKHGWDGYSRYTNDSDGLDRILESELNKKAEISEYFEGGWKIFLALEPQLRKLNRAVPNLYKV